MNSIQDHDIKVAQTNLIGIRIQNLIFQRSWYRARSEYAEAQGRVRAQSVYQRVLIFIESQLNPLLVQHEENVREIMEFRQSYEINENMFYYFYVYSLLQIFFYILENIRLRAHQL
jgi:hypothetical protein